MLGTVKRSIFRLLSDSFLSALINISDSEEALEESAIDVKDLEPAFGRLSGVKDVSHEDPSHMVMAIRNT